MHKQSKNIPKDYWKIIHVEIGMQKQSIKNSGLSKREINNAQLCKKEFTNYRSPWPYNYHLLQ